ncbi:MAG TPA: hypothetical protein PKI60_04175 [Oscillospiraceae bacterium]|nr:hypothetical protein [Oscillospiraceae bacterium]
MSDCNIKSGSFKEAVCVEAQRIYDSCCDKDCLSDLPVRLDPGTIIPQGTTIIRSRSCEIYDACIAVDCVPFDKGFYSVDITYKFRLTLDTYTEPCGTPTPVAGTCTFTKKVILFGSEGNAKTFTSANNTVVTQSPSPSPCCCQVLPVATVQAVNPIVLDAKIIPHHHHHHCCGDMSEIASAANCLPPPQPEILVTLGVFSIVQLTRTVSMLIPVYDFCMPSKECLTNTENPCEIFDKISFPTDEFFPPAIEHSSNCGC